MSVHGKGLTRTRASVRKRRPPSLPAKASSRARVAVGRRKVPRLGRQ